MNNQESNLRIIIVDDHQLFAAGLKALLNKLNFYGVETFSSAEEFLECRNEKAPELAFIDLQLGGMDGFELIKTLFKKYPSIKIIMLTFCNDGDIVHKAITLGVNGYLTKDLDPSKLKIVIQRIRNGEQYITPSAALNHSYYLMQIVNRTGNKISIQNFSEREMKIINLIFCGKTEKEMASELNVSYKTIQSDKKRIVTKMGIKKQSEILSVAHKLKLIH